MTADPREGRWHEFRCKPTLVPVIDRRGAEPVKVGEAVVSADERGIRVEGTVGLSLPATDGDLKSFSINPTERETMQTKIRIHAGEAPVSGMGSKTGESVEVEVDTDASTGEVVEKLVEKATAAATELAAAAGIVSYEPSPQDAIAEEKRDDPEAEEERETPEAEWLQTRQATYKRMHDAITTAAPNLREIAEEMLKHDDERIQTLGKAVQQEVHGLVTAQAE